MKKTEACKIKTIMEKMNRKKVWLLTEKSNEVIKCKWKTKMHFFTQQTVKLWNFLTTGLLGLQ